MAKMVLPVKIGSYREIEIPIKLSAFEVFKRLYPYSQNLFLLESLGEEGKFNRFSYVGFNPKHIITAVGDDFIVDGQSKKVANPYEELISFFSPLQNLGSDYRGGLVGYVGYEATKYMEPAYVGHTSRDFPEFQFGLHFDGLKFDKKGKRCFYFHHGENRLEKILGYINHQDKLASLKVDAIPNTVKEMDHARMVKAAQEHIRRGDIFQAVLSLKSHFRLLGDTRRLYAVLRQINPSPYMSYLKFGDREIISASPELLIRVKGKNIEHFGTLAGTVKRGKDDKEDAHLARQLREDKKEMAEHMMLVDLARNDLGRICEFGSVKVEKLATVKRYAFVQHLYTEVFGRLKKGEHTLSALRACFPAGTLSGAPKIEAMKIIAHLEKEARGPYGGVIGYVSFSGEAMFAIAIRTLFIKGEHAYTQTGSGIVLDSQPAKEYQEIVNKQKAMTVTLTKAQRANIKNQSDL